jgi:DNA/RNA endonuclease YhcR with UshA esterase domain
MTSINFPASPSLSDEYTFEGRTWVWNGTGWAAQSGALTPGQISNADIAEDAGIVDTKLATISTAGKVSNSATTATSANTASAIVARDSSGNFTAGTITAALSGNAASATDVDDGTF